MSRYRHGNIPLFTPSVAPRKPGVKIDPRTDLTHCFFTGTGTHASFQGTRCKILRELAQGRVLVEFEKGDIIVVSGGALKELPK